MNQLRESSCGPLCLEYLSGQHRVICAGLAGTSARGETHPDGMKMALKTLGYQHVEIVKWTRWEDLRNGHLVLWWSGFPPGQPDGHWSVVTLVHPEGLEIWDPDLNRTRVLPRLVFESRWYDFTADEDLCRVSVAHDILRGLP